MRPRVAQLGIVEWMFIFAVLALIVAEIAAYQQGLGWYAAIIALGYGLAVVTAYLLYRHDKITAASTAGAASILKDVDIFKDLSDREIDLVGRIGERLHVPAGKVLGRAGEEGDYLYIIIDGQVQLSAPSAIGEITVRIAGPGESFPLATLIGSGILITSVTTMTEAELLAIPRAELQRLWKENPAVGMRMYSAVAEVLAGRYRSTLSHLSSSAEQALEAADFWANV